MYSLMQDAKIAQYIHRKAVKGALQFTFAAESVGGVMIRIALLAAYIGAVAYFFSAREATAELWMVAAAMAPVLLTFPLSYLWERNKIQMDMIRQSTTRVRALQSKIETDRAILAIDVATLVYGGTLDEHPEVSNVTMFLVVRNKGSRPSAALNWSCLLVIDQKGYVFAPNPGDNITMGNDQQEIVLKQCDSIFEKTYTPIPAGGVVSGYFFTFVPAHLIEAADKTDAKILVRCEQVDGTEVRAEISIGAGREDNRYVHIPGLTSNFKPKG